MMRRFLGENTRVVLFRTRILTVVTLLLRIALGAIFVYAAWSKLKDPWALFAMAIDSYQVLPTRAVEWLARTLPWLELLIGVLLIAGRFMRISTLATSLLLLVFFGLMVRAYAKGMEINCGCFGPGEALSWKTLARDGSMLAAALLLTAVTFVKGRGNVQGVPMYNTIVYPGNRDDVADRQ